MNGDLLVRAARRLDEGDAVLIVTNYTDDGTSLGDDEIDLAAPLAAWLQTVAVASELTGAPIGDPALAVARVILGEAP